MNKTKIIRVLLCFAFVEIGLVFFYSGGGTVGGSQMRMGSDSNIDIQLKLVTAKDLSAFFETSLKDRDDHLYVIGRVINGYPDSVHIKLEVVSPNNPTIRVKNISVGWIPANESSPVYFLSYLMQPLLKTDISKVQLDYKILSVKHK